MRTLKSNFKNDYRAIGYKGIWDKLYTLIPLCLITFTLFISATKTKAQIYYDVVPIEWRGNEDYVRQGTHDANRIRTMFYNYAMVGDYPRDPGNVDYTIFHSMEWP